MIPHLEVGEHVDIVIKGVRVFDLPDPEDEPGEGLTTFELTDRDQLRRAHTRMLGRIDAANLEHRRALRAGDTQRALQASRDSLRRHRAGLRILDAMGGAR